MSENKIYFVIQKTSQECTDTCLESLSQLNKVDGFSYEIIQWDDQLYPNKSSEIFNSLSESSKGSYVLFLSDKVNFVHEGVINDIVRIFRSDEKIGLIGIRGAAVLPETCMVDEAEKKYGGCYWLDDEGQAVQEKLLQPESEYTEVEAVDSTFFAARAVYSCKTGIATDIFAEVLSFTFGLHGMKVVVPRMVIPWCFVATRKRQLTAVEVQSLLYEKTFSEVLQTVEKPLLTIGIPTYNRGKYLKKCLAAIYEQIGDIKAVEILVSNNASVDDTEAITEKYEERNNFVCHIQEKTVSPALNFEYLYDHAAGDFFVTCGDDDYYATGTVMRILEAICTNISATIIGLSWWGEYGIRHGSGMDDFLEISSETCTSISSIIFNTKLYRDILDKRKFLDTELNQVYIELEMIRKNPDFTYIDGRNFRRESGEQTYHPEALCPREKQKDFGNVFVRQYYTILNSFLGRGLTYRGLLKEKAINFRKVCSWLRHIKEQGGAVSWRVDDDIVELMEEYFGELSEYPLVAKKIKALEVGGN